MPRSLAGRRFLVTGATGFVGRHLSQRLLEQGSELVIAGRTAPGENLRPFMAHVTFLSCDLADPASVEQLHGRLPPVEAVAHLGGCVLPSSNPADDLMVQSMRVNAEGTARLLDCLPTDVACLCCTSTLDVYGPPLSLPVREDHPTRPVSYYGVSKLAAEGLLRVYSQRTGVPVTVLRLSHVYGPGDTSSKAIPNFIRMALGGQALRVRGGGLDVRDYIYVEDVVDSLIEALTRRVSGTFNIAAGEGHTIREVVAAILEQTGCSLVPEWEESERPVTRVILDNSLARTHLGWAPAVRLDEGLRRTVAWFRPKPDARS